MGDQQHVLVRLLMVQPGNGGQHAVSKVDHRLTARWGEAVGVGPELPQLLFMGEHQISGTAPFPFTKVQLLQCRFQLHGQPHLLAQRLGKSRAALQG
ncbi:hypothetical protein D3C72_2078810 [compost metagenome]